MSNDRKEEMITVRLDRSLKAKMDEREEVNWSGVARKAIRNTIENLETMDEIVARNQLTEEEAREIAESITESANRRARAEREEEDRFDEFVNEFKETHSNRPAFLNELEKAGL